MKRIIILTFVLMLFLTACNDTKLNVSDEKNDFKFLNISWGEDWEAVHKSAALKNAEIETARDNDHMTGVVVKNIDFFGKAVEALLSFGNEKNDTKGLYDVTIKYLEKDETDILSDMTKIYGELRSSFPDKNGIENPINPAGWYTEDRLETVLTPDEQSAIIKPYRDKGWDDTHIDAVLRQPLVIIYFDKENNTVRYSGSCAAFVKMR